MSIILGIDGGNFNTKTVGPSGPDVFRSALAAWRDGEELERFGADDMIFEVDGRKGIAGSVAAYEDEFGGSAMFGSSKAHDDAKIRIILACARYAPTESDFNIVVGQPIITHHESEKQAIREMLIGTHEIVLNGRSQTIRIMRVEIAKETAAAYQAAPLEPDMRILDFGSGTTGAATIRSGRFINSGSTTFNFGTETVRSDLSNLAQGAIRSTTSLKWRQNDLIGVCGGVADRVLPIVKSYYKSAKLLKPQIRNSSRIEQLSPAFANAAGFYEIARKVME